MITEVALTPAPKILWANRPAEFQYPPRDIENEWAKSAHRRRRFQYAENVIEIDDKKKLERANWFQALAEMTLADNQQATA